MKVEEQALQLALFRSAARVPMQPSPAAEANGDNRLATSKLVTADLLEHVDALRLRVAREGDAHHRAELGQFFTPSPVATLMASMLELRGSTIRLLDPGAGVGVLVAACVAELITRRKRPLQLRVTACEVDPCLADYLSETLDLCADACARAGISFDSEIVVGDFIAHAVDELTTQNGSPRFDAAILNPPYKKIRTTSGTRQLLRRIGIETSNLYTAFLAATIHLLDARGEVVAITPRSFCNGTYFRPFREFLLSQVAIRRIHVFESRSRAFKDDSVLQENVILSAQRDGRRRNVVLSSSDGPGEVVQTRTVSPADVVLPDDPAQFIRIAVGDSAEAVWRKMSAFRASIADLGFTVSTGPVVEFRNRDHLRDVDEAGTVPLIYPGHFAEGFVSWPMDRFRKPQAIAANDHTERLLLPPERFVLVRRFSAKEERRRVVAAICDGTDRDWIAIGLENHLNYFHQSGRGLNATLALGLATYLNSTLVDQYFRQFNGHTQVNAGDLSNLGYPSIRELEWLGERVGGSFPRQEAVDEAVGDLTMGRQD